VLMISFIHEVGAMGVFGFELGVTSTMPCEWSSEELRRTSTIAALR
jgi:hypothetical protein